MGATQEFRIDVPDVSIEEFRDPRANAGFAIRKIQALRAVVTDEIESPFVVSGLATDVASYLGGLLANEYFGKDPRYVPALKQGRHAAVSLVAICTGMTLDEEDE